MTTSLPSPTRITCEQVVSQRPAAYGFLPVRCLQSVAIVRWYDSSGTQHAACPRHRAGLESRFPPSDPPEPDWLHLDPVYAEEPPDPIDQWKAYQDWTEAELREAHGG